MLVLSKSGYLSEIEIKHSWSDFLAYFKKKHNHNNKGIIKFFYYCIPEVLLEKVYDKLETSNIVYSGIKQLHPHRKLFLEEQLELARLGSMRVIKLKEKLIENNNG